MFIEFQVGNFRSFRDIQKLTMQAAPLRANDGGLEEGNVFKVANCRLLKTKAIYGSNASGKSNLGKALSAFCTMVSESVRQENLTQEIWEDRFKLLTNWDDQPMFFQYTFILNGILYRYGFEILAGKIELEWLYGKPKAEEIKYFFRGPGGLYIDPNYFTGAGKYMEQALGGDNEIFRTDALFLTGAALNGNKIAADFRDEIRGIMNVTVKDNFAIQFGIRVLGEGTNEQKTKLKNLLKSADTGIEDLDLLSMSDDSIKKQVSQEFLSKLDEKRKKGFKELYSFHDKYNEEGEISERISVPFGVWESQGTSKLLGVGAIILDALEDGGTIIVDEFDAQLHSNLTLKLVELFHSNETNPKNAQLIFITHNTDLLSRANLRRDQICFINKDKYGISSVRTLIEYKGVRKDASYEKEYLQGSYSAVPYLGKLI